MGCISVYSQGIHAKRANSYGVHSGCFTRYSLDISVRETHWGEVTTPKGPSPSTESSTSRHDEPVMNKAKLVSVRFCRFSISDTPAQTPLVSILSTAPCSTLPFHHAPPPAVTRFPPISLYSSPESAMDKALDDVGSFCSRSPPLVV